MASNYPPGVHEGMIPGFRPEDQPMKCPECDAEEQYPGTDCTECEYEIPSLEEMEEDYRAEQGCAEYEMLRDEGEYL